MPSSTLARLLRKQETWAERLVWRWLRQRRFSSYKFRRQHPVGPYCLDFFCSEAMLSIELDGSGHAQAAQRAHDERRTRYLSAQGILELRFGNARLRREAGAIRDTLFRTLQTRAPHPLPDYVRPASSGVGMGSGK